jgi:hypothetical protein
VIDVQQALLTAATAVAGIIPVLLKISHDRRQQHRENQQRLGDIEEKVDEVRKEREYLSPHDHIESGDDPLLASGIIRRRKTLNSR